MIYLALSVLCSVLLGFIFKLFPRFGVDTFQAIVFNYFTCVACATLHLGHFPIEKSHFSTEWMPFALMLGIVFISGFTAAGQTVRFFGLTVAQIMQKMSILMTVPFAILMYGETSTMQRVAGVLFALLAIVLVNLPQKNQKNEPKNAASQPRRTWFLWAIPLVTWVLSGIIEVVFVKLQHEKLISNGDVTFITTVFGTAGVLGLTVSVVGWVSKKLLFSWKNVLAGTLLGIPNYGSMLFILMALGTGMEGSFFFPVCNVAIILLTTLGAIFIFKEKLSKINLLGIALAAIAIVLMAI